MDLQWFGDLEWWLRAMMGGVAGAIIAYAGAALAMPFALSRLKRTGEWPIAAFYGIRDPKRAIKMHFLVLTPGATAFVGAFMGATYPDFKFEIG
jgi:hypothetical protein